MRRRCALLGGRTVADNRRQRISDGRESAWACSIAFDTWPNPCRRTHRVPIHGFVPRQHVFPAAEIGRSVDCDPGRPQRTMKPSQVEMTGKARRLVVETFHQAAVARDHISAMIDQIVTINGIEVAFGDCHPNCNGEPLPSGPVVVSTPASSKLSG